jgi:O-antigen ligase
LFEDRWPQLRAGLLGLAGVGLVAIWALPPIYVAAALVAVVSAAIVLLYPVGGLCLFAFAVPWGTAIPPHLGTVSVTEPIAAGLGFAWLVSKVSSRGRNAPAAPWAPFILLFLAAIVLSTTQATDLAASSRELLKWIEMAIIYVAGTHFIRREADLRLVVAAIVLAGVSQALLGLEQAGLHAGPASFLRGFQRAYGTFDQPNPFAGFLNMTLPLAVAMALLERSRVVRVLYSGAALTIGAGLLASGSRGAYLAAFAALIVMAALQWRRALVAALTGAVALLAGGLLAAFGAIPLGPFAQLMSAVGLGNVSFGSVNDANFSAVERAAHWLAGVRMFASHPLLGVGIGNYSAAYPAYHPRGWYVSLEHAHNYYINIAAEAGIAGLTVYILMVGSALWYSYATVRTAGKGIVCTVGLGVTGALLATNLHNIFDVLYVHGMAAFLGLLVSLLGVRASPFAVSGSSFELISDAE